MDAQDACGIVNFMTLVRCETIFLAHAKLAGAAISSGNRHMVDNRALQAAANNADLYALVFEAQELRFDRYIYAFVARNQPPPYYSNLTVLSPDHSGEILDVLAQLSTCFDGKIGFKDSFCQFDVAQNGFDLLFKAAWIWRYAAPAQMPPSWDVVQNEADLADWEAAWKACGSPTSVHMFRPALLTCSNIAFLGKRDAKGGFSCGAIANASADCAGLSNVFAVAPNTHAFAEASTAASAVFPELPLVGYETGNSLAHARACGFETDGALRILKADKAFL